MTEIEIVSGFLGAGKTTWIRKMLSERKENQRVLLIENEFGEIGVDAGFLGDAGVRIREINSGCICCTLVGDFIQALSMAVKDYSPAMIIIEPSGVGKLSDILKAVNEAKKNADLQISGALTIVDAKKAQLYLRNFGEFFTDQIRYADAVILSHTNGLRPEKIEKACALIDQIRPGQKIITTDWALLRASQADELISGQDPLIKEIRDSLKAEVHHHHHHGAAADEDGRDADDVFESWGFQTSAAYSRADLENILKAIREIPDFAGVLRAKGFVAGEGKDWLYFDYVPGEIDIQKGRPGPRGRICVIGTDLPKAKLASLFGAPA